MFVARPAALEDGHVLGPEVTVAWQPRPWFSAGGALQGGVVSESNSSHQIEHVELSGFVTASLIWSIDDGDVGLIARAGGLFVHESRTRHQSARLQTAGIEGEETGWTLGPVLSTQVAVRLFLLDDFAARLAAGPNVSWIEVQDNLQGRLGWSGSVGFLYRL